jgi:hypothetical protein
MNLMRTLRALHQRLKAAARLVMAHHTAPSSDSAVR